MHFLKTNQQALLSGTAFLIGLTLLFGSTHISLFDILTLFALVATTVLILAKKWYAHIPLTPQNYAVLGIVVLVILQFFIAETDTLFALTTLYLIGVYALVQFWNNKSTDLNTYLIYGYVAGAALSSILGLFAYLSTVLQNSSERVLFFWNDNIRISVLFDDPVVYGAFLVPAVLILSAKAFSSQDSKSYAIYSLLTLLVFSNLILSGSRGAWLNFIVAAGIFALLYKPLWAKQTIQKASGLAAAALALALMLIFVIPIDGKSYYTATLEGRFRSSDKPRIENLRSAPQNIVERDVAAVIYGSGSGSYEKASDEGFSAHNTYLRVLYEQGVVGIILYITFVVFVLRSALKQHKARPLFAALLISLVVGILVQNMFVDTLHWRHFWVLIGLAL